MVTHIKWGVFPKSLPPDTPKAGFTLSLKFSFFTGSSALCRFLPRFVHNKEHTDAEAHKRKTIIGA